MMCTISESLKVSGYKGFRKNKTFFTLMVEPFLHTLRSLRSLRPFSVLSGAILLPVIS